MFENLSAHLESVLKKIRGHGKLSESNIGEALREVRVALLEADVNLEVARDFVEKIRKRAVGKEVMASLTPGQQVIKIVSEELTSLMGGRQVPLQMVEKGPTVIFLVGLQGTGKTTTTAKLGRHISKQGYRPLLVPADVQRPAAIEQLNILGNELGLPVLPTRPEDDPVEICRRSLRFAEEESANAILVDTQGRLHIDDDLMNELARMKEAVPPHETLLVTDAMTGQDAVNMAKAFNDRIGIDGVILTKLDGDARGGAALSVRAVTGRPIKFVGVGEKLDQLEVFHPDRMASRILGMGDVLSLIEKAEAAVEQKSAEKMAKKLTSCRFDLEDFRDQLRQVQQLGPLDQLLGMIPGMSKMKGVQIDPKELKRVEAIINSMTPKERSNYQMINGSRRKRIANGSGTRIQDVNRLLKQFAQTKKMMKRLGKGGLLKKMPVGPGSLPF
jgi:signal recognition particle subunit SRP54